MKRNIHGVFLLDKPIGFTSNAALQIVKKLWGASKAGHTGSLDPIASGMLPICLGEATKFSQFLLDADKHYLVTCRLGETTASGDSETAVITKKVVPPTVTTDLTSILAKFRGKIAQTPPMYSAIKQHGQPLYKLARQGIEVPRTPRDVYIHKLHLLKSDDNLATFEIHCSKGTYIRTLIADIGEALGCGAHVVALRRLAVAHYQAAQMVPLEQLRALATPHHETELSQLLLPIETMVIAMPAVTLTQEMSHYAFLGNALLIPSLPKAKWVKLTSKEGQFLGVGEVMPDGKVAPRKMVRVKG